MNPLAYELYVTDCRILSVNPLENTTEINAECRVYYERMASYHCTFLKKRRDKLSRKTSSTIDDKWELDRTRELLNIIRGEND